MNFFLVSSSSCVFAHINTCAYLLAQYVMMKHKNISNLCLHCLFLCPHHTTPFTCTSFTKHHTTLNIVISIIWCFFGPFGNLFLNENPYDWIYKCCHPTLLLVHPNTNYGNKVWYVGIFFLRLEIFFMWQIWRPMFHSFVHDICNLLSSMTREVRHGIDKWTISHTFHVWIDWG